MNHASKYGLYALLLATLLLTAACGIKPGRLEPPADSPPNNFPRDYPQE